MSELNPPDPLAAAAGDTLGTETVPRNYIAGGRRVHAGRGWGWIRDGIDYFRRQPGIWIILTLIFFALMFGLSLVPLVGSIITILVIPVLVGGLLAGCRTLENGAELELAHLFAGFRAHTGPLMLVGVIGFALTAAIMIPAALLIGTGGMIALATGSTSGAVFGTTALIGLLLALALFIPVNMAMWFAPALVMLQAQSAPRAIAESFRGCLRNIVPFLVYSVILFVLAMIASIPLGLGWLVLGPVVFGSVYAAYRDIYFEA
jgi:uncharacterized membrane protein